MKKHLTIVAFIASVMLCCSCTPNDHLDLANYSYSPDSTHWKNQEQAQLKETVITTYKDIDQWYQMSNNYINLNKWYGSTNEIPTNVWQMKGYFHQPADSAIVTYLNKHLPDSIAKTNLLTENFKTSLIQRCKTATNPMNLAGLMSQDSVTYELEKLYQEQFHSYREYLEYEHGIKGRLIEENDDGIAVDVSADSVQNCLMEMVSFPSTSSAIMAVPYYILQSSGLRSNKFFLFFYIKEDNHWLLDDFKVVKNQRN
ncbi:hypothetical protein N7E81_15305 [Reichenbachiella carrageenanivorans]|uniref:Lipoprotein n=1 Tax=Reichenbachiella carrageenanivorans TaxID=2979869 RepID=A0ABY6CXT6_9BACT|nr:hypothetical protein [Reichenbachiella carrageenanivorans]UXX78726.1 hypothetical protein N7E81_15305 [Reichenbachiella carrageenanivorans]